VYRVTLIKRDSAHPVVHSAEGSDLRRIAVVARRASTERDVYRARITNTDASSGEMFRGMYVDGIYVRRPR
jgi:hypothetical protein